MNYFGLKNIKNNYNNLFTINHKNIDKLYFIDFIDDLRNTITKKNNINSVYHNIIKKKYNKFILKKMQIIVKLYQLSVIFDQNKKIIKTGENNEKNYIKLLDTFLDK